MTDTIVSLSDLVCAQCGNTIDVQPGEIYIGSTDGRVWHYGCKSRNAMSEGVGELVGELQAAIDEGAGLLAEKCIDALTTLQARLAEVTGALEALHEYLNGALDIRLSESGWRNLARRWRDETVVPALSPSEEQS